MGILSTGGVAALPYQAARHRFIWLISWFCAVMIERARRLIWAC